MKSIYHKLLITTPAEKIYEALTTRQGLCGWWTDTEAIPETGSIARFTFSPDYYKEMKITELVPSSRVQWVCIAAVEEWIGTTISFELRPHAKGTLLFFRHDGWKEYSEIFADCNYNWALFMRSLKLFCETSTGRPSPNQVK